jgi:hypothetical protein
MIVLQVFADQLKTFLPHNEGAAAAPAAAAQPAGTGDAPGIKKEN